MSNATSDVRADSKRLLTYLRRMQADRGAMANLRGALTPARRHRAWPLLGAVGGIGNPRYEIVAALFAFYPEGDNARVGNLGETARRLATESNTFEVRFRRLLTCDRTEVAERVPPIVFAAKAKGIPVNFEELFVDLTYWSDAVKERWARTFWSSAPPEAEEPA